MEELFIFFGILLAFSAYQMFVSFGWLFVAIALGVVELCILRLGCGR